MKIVVDAVMERMSRQGRGILVCLFAGLALAGLSACGGSSESALVPGTVEPIPSQQGEGDAEQGGVETTQTEPSTEELDVFESLNFLAYAARTMRTEVADLVPRDAYEIAGTSCQGKSFDYAVREMDGNAIHFAVTPSGERIAGSAEGAVQAVWSACYNSQGIQITSDQLIQLVVHFGEVRFSEAEDESTMFALQRNRVDYEPPNFVHDADDFTLTFLLHSREFGDVFRVRVERTGEDMTVEYEEPLEVLTPDPGLFSGSQEGASCSPSTEPILLTLDSVAGLPLTAGAEAMTKCLNTRFAAQGQQQRVPIDGFWGPFATGCFDYVDWPQFLVSTCEDGSGAGWSATLNEDGDHTFELEEVGFITDLEALSGWPQDTAAHYRPDVDRWFVHSQQLGLVGAVEVSFVSVSALPTSARSVLPGDAAIISIWTEPAAPWNLPASGDSEDVTSGTIESFVPPGFEVLSREIGDLDADQYDDVILVLKRADEEEFPERQRPVLLLRGLADGRFALEARNDAVAMCTGCGGTLGDPFQRVVINDRFFSFEHFGGSRETWFRVTTFRFNLETEQWELTSDRSEVIDRLAEGVAADLVTHVGNAGAVFSTFDGENW